MDSEQEQAQVGDWVKIIAEDDDFMWAIGKVLALVDEGVEILIMFYDDSEWHDRFLEKYGWQFEHVGGEKGIKAVYHGCFLQHIEVEE